MKSSYKDLKMHSKNDDMSLFPIKLDAHETF